MFNLLRNARALREQGRFGEAIAAYETATQVPDAPIEAWAGLADGLLVARFPERALAIWDEVLRRVPGLPAALCGKAMVHHGLNDIVAARALYEAALAGDPACFPACLGLIRLHVEAGRLDLAATLAGNLSATCRDRPEIRWLSARIALGKGDPATASALLASLLDEPGLEVSQRADILLLHGEAFGELGRAGDAFAAAVAGKAIYHRLYAGRAASRASEAAKLDRLARWFTTTCRAKWAAPHDLAAAAYRAAALAKLSVPLGIVSGLIGGNFYNRFGTIKLPDYLAFFGGRRFVPIVSGLAGIGLALVFGGGYDVLNHAIDAASHGLSAAGPLGLFVYGLLNRLLLVTGLHHILNNVVWFILGDFHGATGDLNRFFAGDPSAGRFMAGFFPVMIFGLPAACFAMYRSARPERRAEVSGLLMSLALTAMLTGVTEPIEFTFIFLAPVLFAIHAVLTGVAMVVMDALGVRLGFGFSAGLFDYGLNFGRATRPLLLVPVGLVYAGLYYGLFRFVIVRFDLKTPGREAIDPADTAPAASPAASRAGTGSLAGAYLIALGGVGNLAAIDACTTRLRLVVLDQAAVDEGALRRLGARGVVRLSATTLQVVIGPVADSIAREMRDAAGPLGQATASTAVVVAPVQKADTAAGAVASTVIAALGGQANIAVANSLGNRLLVTVRDDTAVDRSALAAAGRGVVSPVATRWHLLFAGDATWLAAALGGGR